MGGPIIKDRLFYFFTYDGFRRVGRALYYRHQHHFADAIASNYQRHHHITPTQCPATITATQCTSAITFLLLTSAPLRRPRATAKENLFFPRLDYHINSQERRLRRLQLRGLRLDLRLQLRPEHLPNSSPSTNGPTNYHERFW